MPESSERISRFYDDLVSRYGSDPRSCDYGSPASQLTKFDVLAGVADFTGRRVLDVGCGLADYADYLSARFAAVSYTGIDLSPAMVAAARARRPELDLAVGNVLAADFAEPFDIVNANGIFYLLGGEAPDVMHRLVERMWSLARVALAFNSLSTWAPERHEGEFQADPSETLAFCRTLSPWVVLRHDYMPHDFTVYLYRDQQG